MEYPLSSTGIAAGSSNELQKAMDETGLVCESSPDLSGPLYESVLSLLRDIDENRLKFIDKINEDSGIENSYISGRMIDGFTLVRVDESGAIVAKGSTKLSSFTPKQDIGLTPGRVVVISLDDENGEHTELTIGYYQREEKQFMIISRGNASLLVSDATYQAFVYDAYCKVFDFHNEVNNEFQMPEVHTQFHASRRYSDSNELPVSRRVTDLSDFI